MFSKLIAILGALTLAVVLGFAMLILAITLLSPATSAPHKPLNTLKPAKGYCKVIDHKDGTSAVMCVN